MAVFGLTTEDTAITSSAGPNIQFKDAYKKQKKLSTPFKQKKKSIKS
ncbi:hypothetical protein ACEQPO_05965 [Bacillus sp. SL00103]